jgi:catechol 2,3-dioxygenase-like lactoylglutathione lyase family enzyme
MYGKELSYVALIVDDVDAAAGKLERDFGLLRTSHRSAQGSTVPFLSVGRSALALFGPGDPYVGGERRTGVHHIALAVDDVQAARKQLSERNLAFENDGFEDGIDGSHRALLSLDATNGIRTYLAGRIDRPEGKPDFIDRMDHLGVIGTDNARVVDTYCTKLGCTLDGEQFDTELQTSTEHFVYKSQGKTRTVVYTRPTEFVAAVHDVFITTGDCELEVIQTLDTDHTVRASGDTAGNTRQDHGALARFLSQRGPGLHHVAFKVRDIDARLERLRGSSYRVIDERGRAGARCSRIGFIHPKSMNGVLMHLVERPDVL